MQITEAFKDKTLVITGGTGSFGSTVLKHFLTSNIGEIRMSQDAKNENSVSQRENGVLTRIQKSSGYSPEA